MLTARPEREVSDARSQSPDRLPAAGSDGVRRELVRRIVNSPTFARSERLGTLLTYVCDLTLKGREAEINEQNIGHAVFGRPRDYDSAVDGIVRSQASRLRQRLELYFQHEGADEPMRVTIPRGGYVPLFETQDVAGPQPATAELDAFISAAPLPPSAPIPDNKPKARFAWRWLPWGLSLLLAF